MKKLFMGLSFVLATGTAQAASTPVSWASINKNLDVVAQEVKAQNPFLTSLSVNFDASASNLDADRLSASMSAGTDQAAWGDKKAQLDLGVSFDGSKTANTQRVLDATVVAKITTQAIPAIKHLTKSMFDGCASNPAPAGPLDNYEEIRIKYFCELITKVNATQNIVDLQVALITTYSDYLNFVGKFIQEQKELLQIETDEDKKNVYQWNIDSAESDMKELSKVKVSGDMKNIVIDYAFDWQIGMGLAFTVNVAINEGQAAVTLGLGTKIEETDYQDYKKLTTEFLVEIENNKKATVDWVRDLASGYAEFIAEYITK